MELSAIFDHAPATAEGIAKASFDCLDQLGIAYTCCSHDTAHTMDDCVIIGDHLGVDICKNLVLTPRNKSAYYLLCIRGDKPFVTKEFSKLIGASRLSFASAEDMEALLGVHPGSASILSLMNDKDHRVQLAVDRDVWESEFFGCHPCDNNMSLKVKTEDIKNIFLPYTGHEVTVVDL